MAELVSRGPMITGSWFAVQAASDIVAVLVSSGPMITGSWFSVLAESIIVP